MPLVDGIIIDNQQPVMPVLRWCFTHAAYPATQRWTQGEYAPATPSRRRRKAQDA
jgi:hypothetical protein